MGNEISRRSFLKNSAIAMGAGALFGIHGVGRAFGVPGQDKSQVFFTKDISANGLLKKSISRLTSL